MPANPDLHSLDPGLVSQIRLLALDFDGVMTDNKVYVSEDGTESVRCDRGDSMGIAMLRDTDVEAVVISRETNPVVEVRCRKIGIPVVQGVLDKIEILTQLCAEKGILQHEVIFLGNDVNDVECMEWAGVSIAPVDAHRSALAVATVVTSRGGGDGAVREVTDLLVDAYNAKNRDSQ